MNKKKERKEMKIGGNAVSQHHMLQLSVSPTRDADPLAMDRYIGNKDGCLAEHLPSV